MDKLIPNNEPQDFRLYLQEEFMRRLKKNPQYSVRAFAGFLEVHSGTLSQILSGIRPVGKRLFERMATKLNLDPLARQRFLSEPKAKGSDVSFHSEQLTLDTFRMMSEWYHFALLEIVKLHGFQSDAKWMAKQLGLTTPEVNMALERLQRLNLLERDEEGAWRVTSNNVSTLANKFTNVALRKLQKQILSKAIDALDEVDYSQRDQSSLTVAIRVDELEQVKEMITQLRRAVNQKFEERTDLDAVYNLTIGFYPLTKVEKNDSNSGKKGEKK